MSWVLIESWDLEGMRLCEPGHLFKGGSLFEFVSISTDEDTFLLENNKTKDKEFVSLNKAKQNNWTIAKEFEEEISVQILSKIPHFV